MFWDIHEPEKGVFDFSSGNKDLLGFLSVVREAGLFVNLRVGPYVCAEWNYGGLPAWLREEPGIVFRDYNKVHSCTQPHCHSPVRLIACTVFLRSRGCSRWRGS